MKSLSRNSVKLYLALAMAGLAMLYLWPSLVAATPLTPRLRLERAWKLATDIGVYKHRSEVVQTSHPTPRLENSGRSPKVDRLIASGFINLHKDELHLTLEGMNSNQPAIEMKVENGKSYGRQLNTAEWVELEDSADVFGSGGDPLGFLAAMENVQAVSSSTLDAAPDTPYSHFSFDINGPRYAEYVAAQMEAALRERGELPAGMSLGMADQYLKMKAHGEIWLNDEGLPSRQILHLEFPPERDAYEWYEADITTTFQGWDTGAIEHQLFWAIPRIIENPSILVDDPLSLLPRVQSLDPETMQMMGLMLGLSLLLAALALFVFTHRHSRKMYAALSLAVIISMLATPLIQSNHALAFSQQQHARQAEYKQQQENQRTTETLQAEMAKPDFNPMVDPLAISNEQLTIDNSQPATIHNSYSLLPQLQATSECDSPIAGDTDCDGNADDDGDGLTDEVEVVKLGTDPNNIDTDGDRISDKVEVEGFNLGGQQWYLDPVSSDSNNDGRQDFSECINLVDVGADGTWPISQLGSTCNNTDGDTTPDVFDFDDDGDGVPDAYDSAPTFTGNLTTNAQSDVTLDLSNFTPNKTLLVDFELRPANPNHLWQNNNVFDWPNNDLSGQITRVFTTTFADVEESENPLPELSQGDVMLTPMLQIKMAAPISNTTNPSAGLPLDPTFNGDITTAVLTDWVDIDVMNDYAITLGEDEVDDSIYAYLPLSTIKDDVGDTPVAWGARMVYRPELATWGLAHQVKLIWLVTALTDRCDTSGLSNPDDPEARAAWCSDYGHWITEKSLIQTYYEDFNLTGLTVTEDHGSKVAVAAQTDALNVNYESHLWQLARGLQSTFITGDQIGPDTRFTIEEIKNRFDKDTTPYTTGDEELWGIPNDKLIVRQDSAVDQTTSLKKQETIITDLLGSTYSGATTNDAVTLLLAREDTSKAVMLEESDAVIINNNAISVDMGSTPLTTYAAINFAPYQYGSSEWNAYNSVDYLLDELEPGLEAELLNSDIQAIVPGEIIRDENLSKDGAIMFAKNFYLALYQGMADMVEYNGQLISEDIINNNDFSLNGQKPVTLVVADILDLLATLVESERVVSVNGDVVANSNFEAAQIHSLLLEIASYNSQGAAFAAGASQVGVQLARKGLKKWYKKHNNFSKTSLTYGKWAKRMATFFAVASSTFVIFGPKLIKGLSQRDALIIGAGISVGGNVSAFVGAYGKIDKLRKLGQEFDNAPDLLTASKVVKQTHAVRKVIKFGSFTGFVGDVGLALGFAAYEFLNQKSPVEWGSVQGNLIFAETIGQIVVAIIFLVISLTPIGGAIEALIGLIDVITGLICEALQVDPNSGIRKWVCGGFSGAAANGIAYLIYDNYVPYDVNNKDRLDIVFGTGNLIKNTDTDGFVAGNSVRLSATISNTINLAKPERLIIKTSYLKGNATLDRERLKNIGKTSTFKYSLNASPSPNAADSLSLNGTTWQGDTAVFNIDQEVVLGEGVNSYPSVYLNEAYDLAAIDCWGFIGADEAATCREDNELKGVNDTFIGNLLTYDVMPTTIDGFPDFFRTAHPQLDSDGDGLLSTGSGLTDPDDTTWDTDQDGLSDFWEMNHKGFDPEDPDSDDDGLYDYWEAFNQTQANLPDSDSDGLSDSDEFFHSNARDPYGADNSTWSGGWTIVYDYNGSQSLQTRVSADPLDTDSDGDTILDNLERAYGYHPNLPSNINVLTLDSRTDAPAYLPNSTIGYTATVKNELDNRVAYGLLETEFPVDVVKAQQTINALYPQVETGLSGTLTAPNTGQSLTQDLVVRAGALIDTTAVDEVFVLPFDETSGSTTFLDATSARRDFTCTTCPTANSGTATFNGSQKLTRPDDNAFNLSTFSLSARIKPAARGGVIYNDANDFKVEQLSDGTIQATFEDTQLTSTAALALDKWNYVVVTYDAGEATIFVNSIESASGSVGTIARNDSTLEIGSGFQGDMDRIALHTKALTKEDILDVFNGLTMYASFDDGTPQSGSGYCGFTDAISQRSFDCDAATARDEYRWGAAYPDGEGGYFNVYVNAVTLAPNPDVYAGVVGDSVSLAQNGPEPPYDANDRNGYDDYLHFNHEVSLAGTMPGENDNAFSIAMWIHAANPYLPAYWIPKPDEQPDYDNTKGTILTLPDQPGVDNNIENSTNPMYYTAGDGEQVRVEALSHHDLKVDVGGCTATIDEFMFKGQPNIFDQFNNTFSVTPADYWQHLIIAFNGQNKLNLYQNGELVSSTDCFTTTDFRTVNGFTLGYSSLTNDRLETSNSFWGYVDELRFYNRSFTAAEARELYLNTNVKFDFNGRTGQTFFQNDSPSGSFGTCSGASCPQSGLPSLDNQAVKFDGNDYIELSENADATGLKDGSFTIMGWVKGNGGLLGVQPDGNNNWLFAGVSGNKPKIYWTGATGAEASTPLDPNQWNHVAFRYQENDINGNFLGEIKIYVNGVLAATQTNNLAFGGDGIPRIGQSLGGNFTGMIDNVVVAGYALTPAEIRAYMNQAPILNFHLDEGLENVLQNFTSFSDDGVLGLTATCSGDACPVAGSRGQMREALVFDGDDMLTIPDNDALDLEDFSIGLWVKPQQEKDSKQTLLVKGSNSNTDQNYGLFIKPNSMKVEYSVGGFCGGSLTSGESTGSLNKDQWNHVVMTSGFTPNGVFLKLYINGAFQGETFTYSPCHNAYPIRIGDSPAAGGFEGSLDEITLHNVELNAAEIQALYAYQSSWYDTTVHHQIAIDAEQPQVDVGASPTFLNQATRLLSLSAYDPGSGIQSVSVKITDPQDGETTQQASLSMEPNSAAWFYTFAPNQAGRYTIQATATDNLGYTKTATKYIDVDAAAPGMSLASNSYDAESEQLTLSGNVFDTVGYPRSGVATETMTVDVQDRNGNSISGPIAAAVTPNNPNDTINGTWNVTYPFPAIPYGQFTTLGTVADSVGNTYDGTISNGAFELDEIGPIGDVVIDTDILGSLTPEIQGTASDFGYLLTGQQTVFHFEDAPGATQFIDGSPGQVVATCVTSDCPTAWQNGKFSRGAGFDGLDDLLELGTSPAISGTQAFAVSAWLYTNSSSKQIILQQRSVSTGDGQYQLSLNADGTVNWSLDGSDGAGFDIDSTSTVNNNQWRHILAVREADGTGRIYIDGVADGVESSTPRTLLEAPVFIGGDGLDLNNFFKGALDEVTIYSGAPTADEAYYMANPLVSSITDVQVRFRSFAEQDISQDEGTWYPADVSSSVWFTTWSLALPALSPGNYKIDLKATDSHGNTRYIGDAWTGGVLDYDLQISAEADVSSVVPGDQITYTATYTNSAGSGNAVPGVEITLAVPVDMSFNAGLNDSSWSCFPNTSTGSICTYPVGTLESGASGVMTVTLDVLNQISAGADTVSNTLTIGPLAGEQSPADNSATVETPVEAQPELTVSKDLGGVIPLTDSQITYTITVTNTGNQGATVVLTETVPANSQTGIITGPPWDCEGFGGPGENCVLELGVVPAGEITTTTFSLYIDTFVPDNAVLTNTVQVGDGGNDGELDLSDNEYTLVSPIDQGPEPSPFGVEYDPVIINEGEVATNTLHTICDPDPLNLCEIAVIPSVGETAYPDDPNLWRFYSSDGPDESTTVEITFLSSSGNTSTSFELTVLNVAPTIAITGNDTAQVDSVYTATLGSVVDPGDDTVTTCTLNWGDGNSDDCLTAIGGGSLGHTYTTEEVTRTLTVDLTDEDGLYLMAGSKVISFTENTAPVFATIDPQTIAETETLTFTAVATDANGDTVTYSLDSAPFGATISPTSGLFTWVTDENDGPGVYFATIIASDGSLSATTTSLITVTEVNEAPVFGAVTGDPTIDEGGTLSVGFIVSDNDVPAQTLTYGLGTAPDGVTVDPTTGVLTWVTDENDGPGQYPATVLASDGVLTGSKLITLTVNEVNEAPVLDSIEAQTVTAGDTVSFTATASDSDLPAQPLSYSLGDAPTGATIDSGSGLFSWDSDAAGLYAATVIVSDGVLTDSQNVAIIVQQGSVAPQFFPVADQTIAEGMTASYIISAYDANGDTLTYSLSDAPAGATISPTTALFTWATNEEDGPGTYPVTVIASDGVLTDSLTFNITVTEQNVPPILDAIADQSVTDGETLSFTATATDPDIPAQTLTFSLSNEPAGATIDPSTGLFTWAANGVGVYSTTIAVSDGVVTTSQTISITVNEVKVNDPPVLTFIGDQSVDEGETVSFTATATDSDVPTQTLTYSLSDAPAEASIDSSNGAFTWTTAEADGPGVYSATISVSDGLVTDSQTISITVNEVNEAPVLDAIPDQTVLQGETVSFTATATDTDVPAQTLTFSLSDAPAEASIDNSSGTFTWTTAESDILGVYSATISVSDGLLTDSQTINITLNDDNTAPVLDPIAPQAITETQTLTFTAVATDAEDDPLTFGLYNASSGMSIDSDSGEFSWTPTEAQGMGAAYFFGLVVSDTGGLTDTTVVMITVNEQNEAPVLAAIGDQTLAETHLFTMTLDATDGDLPANSLSYTMTNAPAGATLDETSGLFSWTPDATQGPGEYSVTFIVSDDGSPVLTDSETITLSVSDSPGVVITESGGSTDVDEDGTIRAGYHVVLTTQPSEDVIITITNDGQVETTKTSLTFTPDDWASSQSVLVSAVDDAVYEGPHTGQITHTASSLDPNYDGLSIAGVVANITDNDPLPSLDIGDVTVDEAVGTATVAVTLTGQSIFPAGVNYTITDGTASGSGVDYNALDGTLTWPSLTNGSQNIAVTIINDDFIEDDETVNISLSNPISATISSGSGVLTIVSEDVNTAPVLAPVGSQTVEAGETLVFTLVATDTDVPTQTLTYGLSNAPLGAIISPTTGLFTWATLRDDGPAIYSATLSVSDGLLTDTETITITVTKTASADVGDYVLFGLNSVSLQQSTEVYSGHVGAQDVSPGPVLDSGAEVSLGRSVIFHDPASEIAADTVALKQNSSVFDIFANELDEKNATYNQFITPLTMPVVTNLPDLPNITPGSSDYNVKKGESLSLAAGAYGTIDMEQDATLTLTGGVYYLSSLALGKNATLLITAPTEIRLAGRLSIGQNVIIGPAAGSGLTGADLVLFIAGINGSDGLLESTPKAVEVGNGSAVTASLYAPNGTLLLGQEVTARGAFIALDVETGKGAQLWHESAFADGSWLASIPALSVDVMKNGAGAQIFLPLIIKAEPAVSTQENNAVPTVTPDDVVEPSATPTPTSTSTLLPSSPTTEPPTPTLLPDAAAEATATPIPSASD